MKHLKTLILLCLTIGLVSCSSSDDSGDDNPQTITGDYFPSAIHNFWNYNVVNTSQNDPAGNFTATDNLVVVTESGNNFTLQVNDGTAPANGTLNALLVNATALTRTSTTLTFNGVLDGPPGYENFIDQPIELNDVVLYDLNASDNAVLSTNSNTIEQDLTVGADTYPITINYDFISRKVGFSNSETVNGVTYNNVVKTEMTLNLSVSTSIEVDIIGTVDVSILDPQDVLTINAWYAEDIGVIAAYSSSSYQLSDEIILVVGASGLGVPESDSSENRQELDSYSLN